jgi:hypothetical protein
MTGILAELLSTIGMILLAGEYLQGRSRWFNRSLENLALRLFPTRFFFRKAGPPQRRWRSDPIESPPSSRFSHIPAAEFACARLHRVGSR